MEPKAPFRRLQGMRVRDEFLCPITFEIMMDPTIAADGHSYERSAIDKWMRTNNNSPRTGEPLDNKTMISNINLKKLIQDLISEGGAGLYTSDVVDKGRMIELMPQKVLVMQCLGPAESEWNHRVFQVTPAGALGGRKMPDKLINKDFIVFKDSTVSRKHFEITYENDRHVYSLRDLGSAGGSFVRIPFGTKKYLHPGMILLMGKHQFTVSSIDVSKSARSGSISAPAMLDATSDAKASVDNDTVALGDLKLCKEEGSKGSGGEMKEPIAERATAGEKEEPIAERATAGEKEEPIAERATTLNDIMTETEGFLNLLEEMNENDDDYLEQARIFQAKIRQLRGAYMNVASSKISFRAASEESRQPSPSLPSGCKDEEREIPEVFANAVLTLTCFAPDGSPMQGRNFFITSAGATIGRKPQCTISMCIKASEDPSFIVGKGDGDKLLNIDSAVSTDHAKISMDPQTGQFFILDGAEQKSSTNGTWYRLSGPHQESPPHDLTPNMEVLLGTVRFQVGEAETILERSVKA